jgi:hypothetical protein
MQQNATLPDVKRGIIKKPATTTGFALAEGAHQVA